MRLASLIERFEPELMQRHAHRLLPGARRALGAMKRCRNDESLKLTAECVCCYASATVPHSCGHRSCPHCQHHDSEQWLAKHRQQLLPVDYFLITFTVPRSLRALAFAHQRIVYNAMLRCAWQSVAQFARNDGALGVELGASAVLHTHNRQRDFHPHVHLLVPAGGVNYERTVWRRKNRYLFNEQNLATVFRGKLLSALKAQHLQLPANLEAQWVADCTRVGRGDKALAYLARYLYRGVLSERDILSCHHGNVTFAYTHSNGTRKTRTLPGADFLWLLLQHVLPKGFHRARDYGLLHHKRALLLKRVQCWLNVKITPFIAPQRPALRCKHCGAAMRIIATRTPCHNIETSIQPFWFARQLPV